MISVLRFLGLLDHEGNLSLSNLSLIASTVLSFINPPVGAVTLLGSLLNYAHKRNLINEGIDRDLNLKRQEVNGLQKADEIQKQIEALSNGLTEGKEEIEKLKAIQPKLVKQAEETKALLAANNLVQGMSFTRAGRNRD